MAALDIDQQVQVTVGVASPRATEPKTRMLRTPNRTPSCVIASRCARTSSSVTARRGASTLTCLPPVTSRIEKLDPDAYVTHGEPLCSRGPADRNSVPLGAGLVQFLPAEHGVS
jgi:hypothetical protein